mmetsp:Transcript_80340/g.232108  ORF Transcript_80340/g.232108 Transcript_80340/m.232108 type:complete len:428 (-) Transcript_80340:81-1364(-)
MVADRRSRSRSREKPPISSEALAAEIEAFLRAEPEVEERAATMLRSKSAEVQKLVIARGGLAGTRNPTAVLVSRIRNAEEGLRPVLETERAPEEIERFLIIERVEPHAAARLRRASRHVQQAVVSRGSLAGTRDPTAVLMTRIRDAEKEHPPPEAVPTSQDLAEAAAVAAAANPYGSDPQAYALAYYAQYQQAYPQAVQGAYAGFGAYPGVAVASDPAQVAAAYAAYGYPGAGGYYAVVPGLAGYPATGTSSALAPDAATQPTPALADLAPADGGKDAHLAASQAPGASADAFAASMPMASAVDAAAAVAAASMPAAMPPISAGYGYAYAYPGYPQVAGVYPSPMTVPTTTTAPSGLQVAAPPVGLAAPAAMPMGFSVSPQIPGFAAPPPPSTAPPAPVMGGCMPPPPVGIAAGMMPFPSPPVPQTS